MKDVIDTQWDGELKPQKHNDMDLSLLRESLAMTPWERMLANDDALNFGETLHAAMKQRDAKPQ